jgi:hypothetical protein
MTDTADKEPNLPPLPAPHSFIGFSDVKRATEDVYSAAQMREYALAALSAVQAVPGWVMVRRDDLQFAVRVLEGAVRWVPNSGSPAEKRLRSALEEQ